MPLEKVCGKIYIREVYKSEFGGGVCMIGFSIMMWFVSFVILMVAISSIYDKNERVDSVFPNREKLNCKNRYSNRVNFYRRKIINAKSKKIFRYLIHCFVRCGVGCSFWVKNVVENI